MGDPAGVLMAVAAVIGALGTAVSVVVAAYVRLIRAETNGRLTELLAKVSLLEAELAARPPASSRRPRR